MRLLIAEDEPALSKALVTIFEKNKYSVDAVYNGNDAYDYGLSGNYDGIILDIMMPGIDGVQVLTKLRQDGMAVPILLLTAKNEITDKVTGLDAGADDYLPKPFSSLELLARVRAMTRRREHFLPDIINFCGLLLNKSTFEILYKDKFIRLVNREFQMIEMLMKSPKTIISTSQFMEHIWGWDSEVEVNIVWVYISNIRKKLLSIDSPVQIKVVRGVGYTLEVVK